MQNIKLQSDSVRHVGEVSLLELKRLIIDQYITAYTAQQQAQFDQEIFSLLKKEEVLLKQLTRSNLYKQTEYLTFLVTLQQQQLAKLAIGLHYLNLPLPSETPASGFPPKGMVAITLSVTGSMMLASILFPLNTDELF